MAFPLIPILLAGGAAYLLLAKPKAKTVTSSTKNGAGINGDKGFKIIVPCQQFEISNKPKSYEYAYKLAIKEIERTQKEKSLFSIGNVFEKLLGCRLFENPDLNELIYSPEYYSWIYFLYRSVSEALLDKKIATLDSVNADLDNYRNDLNSKGLDAHSLPTLWTK